MTPVLPSASGLHIASACDGSFALAQVSGSVSAFSRVGDVLHEFIEHALPGDRDAALEKAPADLRARCAAIDLHHLASLFDGPTTHEVTYGWDPETDVAREFGRGLNRDYSAVPDGWIVGTADAVSVAGDRVVVGDWKSGMSLQEHPSTNLQLRSLALAAARAHGKDKARAIIVIIGEDEWPVVLSADFDELDLDCVGHELRAIIRDVRAAQADVAAGRTPKLSTGDHCRYCRALPVCPAFVGAIQALVPLADRTLTMTPAQIGEQWAATRGIKIMLDRFESAVRFQVERGLVVPLPSGKELRATLIPSRTVSAKITMDVMDELGMAPAFLTAAKVTFTGIERATGDRASEVLAEIEKRGGISTKQFVQIRPLKPKKDGAK